MIPNIFISSTIIDFNHLRDAIRDTIFELEYIPVMSEYGDIGYLPYVSAQDSCYQTLKDCQLAVVLIGKRYGSISQNGNSVTHNEFKTAKLNNKPVICLIEKEVLAYKRVFDLNYPNIIPNFPGMDAPEKTFEFLDDFMTSAVNNGFLEFTTVADVRRHLKRQIAHIFGDLLRNHFDPIKIEIQDILSEVKTLRYELLKDEKSTYEPLLKTFRFLLSERNSDLKDFLKNLVDEFDNAVPVILISSSFNDFVKKLNYEIIIEVDKDYFSNYTKQKKPFISMVTFMPDISYTNLFLKDDIKENQFYQYIIGPKEIIVDEFSYKYFDYKFFQLLETIKSK